MKITVERVRLDKAGYSRHSYYGVGKPAYKYVTDDDCSGTIRADNLKDAKRRLKLKFPNATFGRSVKCGSG